MQVARPAHQGNRLWLLAAAPWRGGTGVNPRLAAHAEEWLLVAGAEPPPPIACAVQRTHWQACGSACARVLRLARASDCANRCGRAALSRSRRVSCSPLTHTLAARAARRCPGGLAPQSSRGPRSRTHTFSLSLSLSLYMPPSPAGSCRRRGRARDASA